MQTYQQFCPVAVAAEVFAQRWTPLILRELLAGARGFNEIRRCLPLIPKSTLVQRLRELEDAGVLVSETLGPGRPSAYRLTPMGENFRAVVEALGQWGQQSAARFQPQNLDAELLMWNLQRRLARDRLPARPTVVRFAFSGLPSSYRRTRVFWLKLSREGVELCVKDPGDDVDLYVEADMATFAQAWLGEVAMDEALRSGRVRLSGPRELVRAFPTWLLLSHLAGHASARVAHGVPHAAHAA